MMPIGIGGQAMSGVLHDVPTDTASSQGVSDFLLWFERALGISVAGQVTNWAASEGLIGLRDVPVGEEGRAVRHGSSGTGGGKDQTDRGVDPALAILIAAVSPPPVGSSLEPAAPGLDRVVDLPSPVMAVAPGVETSRQLATLPPPLHPQGAHRTSEPADDAPPRSIRAVAQPADSPTPAPAETEPLLTRKALGQEADITAMGLNVYSTAPKDPRSKIDVGARIWNLGWERAQDRDLPVEAYRVDVEAVQIEPQGSTQPPPLPPQGVRQAHEPFGVPSVEIGPPLRPGSATVIAAPVQAEPLEGSASAPAQPDLREEGTIPSVAVPRPLAVSERAEAPFVTQRPRLHPQGPHPTLEVAAARATPLMPLANNERSAIDDQPSASGGAQLLMRGAKELQGGISRSNNDRTPEQVGGLPSMVTAVEDPARAAVVSSEESTGRSLLPRSSADRIATPSDSSELLGSEVFEAEGSSDRVQMRRADGDRAVIRLESPRLEATQGLQHDRSASDSDGGSRSSDRSSPPPDDGRQIGADFALAAPSRAEALRSGSTAPSLHTRSLVDQVAEQIATAARLNPRSEGSHVQLRLHPQALGELVIEVSWKESGIVAAIKAQSQAAGDVLASELGRLRTALGDQGIPVSGLGVQVGVDLRQWSFEGNGFRASSSIGYAPEAIAWRDRGSALPMTPAMEPESLIDITV